MKCLNKLSAKIVVLTGALGMGAALAAPPLPAAATPSGATVYQRTDNSESIELSNIPEAGAEVVPLKLEAAAEVGSTGKEAKATTTAAIRPAAKKIKKKVRKMVLKPDGTEEEQWVEVDDDTESADATDGNANGEERSTTASRGSEGAGSVGSGTSQSYGGGTIGPGVSGSASSGSTTSTGGTANSSGTASTGNSASSNGTTTTGGTTSAGSTDSSSGSTAPMTAALANKLETYRNMILSEVSSSQVTNPAITRRYQMMDRATYQANMSK